MKEKRTPDGIKTFHDFWPYYVREHSNGISRSLHAFGTLLGLTLLAWLLFHEMWAWVWVAVIVGYGFAWIGHFVFEKNVPATFRYPIFSLAADFKMLFKILTGQMGAEVKRYVK